MMPFANHPSIKQKHLAATLFFDYQHIVCILRIKNYRVEQGPFDPLSP
jgi:hypothetical protein